MNILITGGAGYIGSHTVKELLKNGYKDIVVVDNLSTGKRENLPKEVRLLVGDFADREVLDEVFSKKIDAVIHFAALKNATESVVKPVEYYENNISKSIVLLDYASKKNVRSFVFSSSAAVYGDVKEFPITEEFNNKPTNPYGWTKLIFEQILSDVSLGTGIKYANLRYFNAGGADPEGQLGNDIDKGEDVVSVLIRLSKQSKEFTIFGTDYKTKDGTCVRDIVHVTDLARAHVLALRHLEKGESITVNLGSEEGFTIRELIMACKRATGKDLTVVDGPRRDGDIVVSIASSKKAKDKLGWVPEYSDLETIFSTAWKQYEACKKNRTN